MILLLKTIKHIYESPLQVKKNSLMWVLKLTGKGSQKAKEARCQVAVV